MSAKFYHRGDYCFVSLDHSDADLPYGLCPVSVVGYGKWHWCSASFWMVPGW
jgi:hypothetical protein